jgi:ABC-type sugar transport system ATPase subunit
MNWFSRNKSSDASGAGSNSNSNSKSRSTLVVNNLDVFYGSAHALQEVSLELGSGLLAVVGRNGMGKSTLCNALTGMV